METDEEIKARLEKLVATTLLRLQRKKEELFGFDLDLIWIEIGVLKKLIF